MVAPSKQEAVKAHDASVERAVKKALAGRPELSDARIDVEVRNGVARLTGTVPGWEESQRGSSEPTDGIRDQFRPLF